MRTVQVQFSGNPKEYSYDVGDSIVAVGDRVVVPNKVKDDGSLSLSIATVVGAPVPTTADAGVTILPIVVVVPKSVIDTVTARIAAAKVAA